MQHDPKLVLCMASDAPCLSGKVMASVAMNRCAAVLCSDKANSKQMHCTAWRHRACTCLSVQCLHCDALDSGLLCRGKK